MNIILLFDIVFLICFLLWVLMVEKFALKLTIFYTPTAFVIKVLTLWISLNLIFSTLTQIHGIPLSETLIYSLMIINLLIASSFLLLYLRIYSPLKLMFLSRSKGNYFYL